MKNSRELGIAIENGGRGRTVGNGEGKQLEEGEACDLIHVFDAFWSPCGLPFCENPHD